MKRLIALFLFLLASISFAYDMSVVGSVKVAPQTGKSVSSPVWAVDTAYSQGQYVRRGDNTFMCLVAGTSGSAAASSAPFPNSQGLFTDTNGITRWVLVPSLPRKGLVLQVLSGTNVSFSLGSLNAANSGIVIQPGGTYGDGTCWDGEVFGVSTGATITVTEW